MTQASLRQRRAADPPRCAASTKPVAGRSRRCPVCSVHNALMGKLTPFKRLGCNVLLLARTRVALLAALMAVFISQHAQAEPCKPAEPGVATLHKLTEDWFSIRGELAGFDPCDRSVSFDKPGWVERPPLMIVVHGGTGRGRDTEMAAHHFRRLGMATLIFDAYSMNRIAYLGLDFFNRKMTNEARQRMTLKVTQGAYEWALTRDDVDTRRIFFWGVSNGATVVTVMASRVDPAHVRAVFAEGLPPQGLGLPNRLQVAVHLAYGEHDDYGTRPSANQRQWVRTARCSENTDVGDLSERNSAACNASANPDLRVEIVEDWFKRMKSEGHPIQMKIYKDAAHDFFVAGPVRGTQMKYGVQVGYSTGATPRTLDEFLSDVSEVVKRP